MKNIFKSKTFWYAIVTGFAATTGALVAGFPEVAGIVVLNTFAQIALRLITVEPARF